MKFKLFFTDYAQNKHVRSDYADPATLNEVISCMTLRLREPDNFVGIIDSDNVILQFMVEDDGTICIDAPIDERKGSYSKHATLDECITLVKSLSDKINPDQIEGLSFKLWGR